MILIKYKAVKPFCLHVLLSQFQRSMQVFISKPPQQEIINKQILLEMLLFLVNTFCCTFCGKMAWIPVLAGVIVLCSWASHFTLIVPLSTRVYKWVLANLCWGQPCDELAPHPGRNRNTPSCSMLQKPE